LNDIKGYPEEEGEKNITQEKVSEYRVEGL